MPVFLRVRINAEITTTEATHAESFDSAGSFVDWWNSHRHIHDQDPIEISQTPTLTLDPDDEEPWLDVPDENGLAAGWDDEAVEREGKMYRRRLMMDGESRRLGLHPDLLAAQYDLVEFEFLGGKSFTLWGLNEI